MKLKAFIVQSIQRYKDYINKIYSNASLYKESNKVWVNIKNIKINRLIKKDNNK